MSSHHHPLVVIDDLRIHHSNVAIHLKSSEEALFWLRLHSGCSIGELWLDYDLGLLRGDLDDVRPVVEELALLVFTEQPFPIEEINVHTQNPVGRERIMGDRLLNETYRMRVRDLSEFEDVIGSDEA